MASSDASTLLVTGATSDIGRSVAHRFARQGWSIGLLDGDAAGLHGLTEQLEGASAVIARALDLTDEEEVQQTVADIGEDMGGRLHVLVNAAGVMQAGRFEQLDLEAHRTLIDGNLWAMLAVTHAAFPLLREAEEARVVSIASASSMYGTPDLASYSAAKAGVRSLTQALNLEWAHHNIHVCDVVPPYVDAPPASPDEDGSVPVRPQRRLAPNLSPEDVADVVVEALSGDRIHWPVGKQFRWIYRLSDVLPAPVVRLLMRYVSGF
ncbi:hypothetical protein BSZ35_03870 [Salinibacter sp. 10B]|uniref:SDR family NAD(P)-dependent oxidoreductase n=1 Tax=Salinibacter sp. 10B TaxID=1923971 RepID=UPI000CF47D6C|nr:SDR family NAD(P)-dependent oxidoreductase [Salinibacter sp. 10B]PQJ33855.1 hypothetical protein BSZ35_03870 [Salinibacter sp. 10B]